MTDRVQDFPAMLRDALGDRVEAEAITFVDMLAEEAVMEFPFAPLGLPERLEGRDAIADHLVRLARFISFDRIGPATLVAREGDTTVLAFTATGRGARNDAPYDQRYLSVIETRSGRIVRYIDYWNPTAVVRALAGNGVANTMDMSEIYGD